MKDEEDGDLDEGEEETEDEEFDEDHPHHDEDSGDMARHVAPPGEHLTLDTDAGRSTDDSDEAGSHQGEPGGLQGAGGATARHGGGAPLMTPSSTTDSLSDTHGKGANGVKVPDGFTSALN